MKNIATVFALASAIFAGSVSAAALGNGNSVEQSYFGPGIDFHSNTHFVNKEQVELNSFSDSGVYNPDLYTQH